MKDLEQPILDNQFEDNKVLTKDFYSIVNYDNSPTLKEAFSMISTNSMNPTNGNSYFEQVKTFKQQEQ
jgi:hypothetical protein